MNRVEQGIGLAQHAISFGRTDASDVLNLVLVDMRLYVSIKIILILDDAGDNQSSS
jgi:hypothetical protein